MDLFTKKNIYYSGSFIMDPYIKKHLPINMLFIDLDKRPLQKREQEKDKLLTQKAQIHLKNLESYNLKGFVLQNE